MWGRYSILEEAVAVDPLDLSWGRGNKIILNSYYLSPQKEPHYALAVVRQDLSRRFLICLHLEVSKFVYSLQSKPNEFKFVFLIQRPTVAQSM